MGKASGQNMASQVTKQSLHGTKNGSVKKDKKPKFKNMPTGKVALIDNMKGQNKGMTPQKKSQKNTGIRNNQDLSKEKLKQLEGKENSPKEKQNSPKGKQISPKGKQNSPKGKQNIPKEKQNIPKGKQTPNKSQKNQGNKTTNFVTRKELEADDSESDSDIDEGIVPQEDIMDEISEDEEVSDTDDPDIFGTSLADDSDVDDEDFEDEEQQDEEEEDEESEEDEDDDNNDVSDEDEIFKRKEGIQMFKGLRKSKAKDESMEASDDDNDDINIEDDDDDEDDDDEDVDVDKVDTSTLESDEDEDEDDDDDDEDEDDDEEEEEDETVAPGLKALLGKSMTDDDDDEDFNEEDEDDEDFNEEDEDDEDDDISDEEDDEEDDKAVRSVQEKTEKKKVKPSNDKDASKQYKEVERKLLSPEEREEIDKRTIFVDNIPVETKAATLKKVFAQYGHINNIRFRSIMPRNSKISKKVAAITQDIHPKAVSFVAYINYKSEESARKALCMNGKKFEGNYVNVQIIAKSKQEKHDNKKAIFLGNLKFGMNNNLIWEHFGKCGDIDSVRLIRDRITGQARGFGYVNFKSEDAVALALKLDGTEISGRPIRIQPCWENSKNQEKGKKRSFSNKNNDRLSKKFKKNSPKVVTKDEGKIKQKKPQRDNKSPEGKIFKSFEGQKAEVKNKKKGSKFDMKKKEMAGKLTAKPKKQKA